MRWDCGESRAPIMRWPDVRSSLSFSGNAPAGLSVNAPEGLSVNAAQNFG